MKTKFSGILTLLLAFVVHITFAQEKTISGTVSDEQGLPLPGVNIIVKGTSNGTQSDFDGNYSINTSVGEVLTFTYVGLKTEERTVGSANSVSVTMAEDAAQLDAVVVTAQGIRREKKALGYSVSTIKSESIERRPESDVSRILSGQIAGVQVNVGGGGFLGSGTNVIIRSKSSITGDNQPLYIVDGAPIVGDRSIDLDPNNIASTSVLKGLAASTLYGEDGRNGVILITTKTGSGGATNKKFEISVSSTALVTEVSNLPDFQNEYGQGADNTINTTFFGTWGARFNGQIVNHPYNIADLADIFPEFQGATVEYKAAPNNVKDFFTPGTGTVNSVQINGGDEKTSYGVSFGHTAQRGYVKENNLRRWNLSFGGRTKLSNNFSIDATANYTNTFTARPTRNLFTLLTWIPRNLDIFNLPFENPNDGSSVYYRSTITNPRWQLKNTGFTESTQRFNSKIALNYDFNETFGLTYRFSLDTYTEVNRDFTNKGGTNSPLGFLQVFDNVETVFNHDILFNVQPIQLFKDVKINNTTGITLKRNVSDFRGSFFEDQVVFDFLNPSNFRTQTAFGGGEFARNNIGVYSSLDFSYKDYLFLNLAARNDWSSTPEPENRSLFYPSASVSFIPTSAFESLKGNKTINYLKLRAGYGSSANFPNAFLTRLTLPANNFAFIDPFGSGILATNSISSFQPNPDIKPELLTEFEVGVEGRFLDNRISLDLSLYDRDTEDQILSRSLPATTGFTSTVINAGLVETQGVEVGLNFTPIKTENFSWSVNNNFTAFETTVVELPEESIDISSGLNFAIEGKALGVIRGTYAVKDDNGNLLINPNNGKIIASDDVGLADEIIGDPNEDWTFSTIHNIRYKNWQLSAQLEYTHGGDIWSLSASNLLRRGVTTDTDDREGTFIIPGVLGDPNTGVPILDGNGDLIRNNIQIGANDLYFINLQDVDENIVYDASTIRLRNVSLSYSLPEKMLEKTPFGSVSFNVTGNNLWYETPNIPDGLNFDPEVLGSGVGNGRGLDFQNDPSYRQYSLGIKVSF